VSLDSKREVEKGRSNFQNLLLESEAWVINASVVLAAGTKINSSDPENDGIFELMIMYLDESVGIPSAIVDARSARQIWRVQA
jgi:hypothetical protein